MRKFNKYKDCIEYLFSLERAGIKYDLKNITYLLTHLGNPERRFKSIHIAGTNGKGSVASMINSILIEKKVKTGLYTSPHIKDFRERILVNGKKIDKNFILEFTNSMKNIIAKIQSSFFEITTAMAFYYFTENNVEFAVIEAGLGGRLDSTNIIKPLISVITTVSIDHSEYLGNTIKQIAKEKAGIIKKNIPCVIGNIKGEALRTIQNKCKKKNSLLIKSSIKNNFTVIERKENKIKLKYLNRNSLLNIPLTGDFQIYNIKTVLSVMNLLSEKGLIKVNFNDIKKGIQNVINNSGFYGRFQLISKKPFVVIDVSHNQEGINQIRKSELPLLKYHYLYLRTFISYICR